MTAGFSDEFYIDAEPTPDTGAFADRRVVSWPVTRIRLINALAGAGIGERGKRGELADAILAELGEPDVVRDAVAAERERIQRRAAERAAQIRQVPADWAAHAAIALDDFAVLLAAEAAAHD